MNPPARWKAIAFALALIAASSVRIGPGGDAAADESAGYSSTTSTTFVRPIERLAIGASSTLTTTTVLPPPPTTTLDVGVNVTGGGRFHGGFTTGQYDIYYFDLTVPRVLVAETSNASGGCNFDTTMELSLDGNVLAFDDNAGPAFCSRITYQLEEPGTYQIKIAGESGDAVPDYYFDVQFIVTECGNNKAELLEECDDGNDVDGDCCSSRCKKNPDGTACDDGLLCDGTDTCASGYCTVHSLSPCPGADGDGNCSETCNDVTLDCTSPDPDGSFCDDALFCNGADRCSQGSCTKHAGNPCRGADGDGDCTESCSENDDLCVAPDPSGTVCDDGLFCNGSDHCLNGLCSVHTGNPCPGADGDANCAESCNEMQENCTKADPNGSLCTDGLFCTGTDTCSGGTCSVHGGSNCPGPDNDSNCAESCNEGTHQCDAVDPNGAACNDGLFCNGNDSCASGQCSTHGGNPCPGPDGDSNCAESCNETSDNCSAADSNGSACNDGVFCNGADTCSAGACSVHAGNPCAGPDGDANCTESCDEALDVCSAPDPNGSACSDSLFCNGSDTCSGGVCSVHAGSPCVGADGDGNCAESCNETADNCTSPDPNGSACNDGLFCNGADTCSAGACSVHTAAPCPGPDGDANCAESCDEALNVCTAADPNGSACNDGLFCNGVDTCASGACTAHVGNPCPGPDGDSNCVESCNETSDSCTAADPNGSACTDGLFCNGTDTCSGGTCSAHTGDPCPGVDGDSNCAESCNETSDLCVAADPNGSSCNDGLFCNGADTCSGGSCSVHGSNPCPGADGDGNCSESCDETGDVCTAADPNGSACNDGLFCNGSDTCSGGSCSVHGISPCPGADGDGNCAESCNEAVDLCTAADPNGATCNDGLFCNGADTCSGGSCSVHAGDPCPGADGDGNCAESCNEAADVCTAADSNGAPCNDGLFCNGADTCSGGSCSVHAGDPCPGVDGDGNCAESCNEQNDACTAADPNGSNCSDGLFCNGADTCASGACSVHAGNPCPGFDGDIDCSETCNETADNCTASDPNGSSCDDGLACNGTDTCLSGGCTQHTGNICPGADGDADCAESCSDSSGGCTAPDPNGTPCDDGVFCNGIDHCSAGSCSLHSGNPCPGPDGDGNCAESCNEAGHSCDANDPNGSACSDSIFCNGADSCSGGLCSAHSGDPCPGPDGDGNCAELCDETADSCTAAEPNGSPCNDGVFCNGTDSCASGACTGHSGTPCAGPDGDDNCAESCNEQTAACSAADPDGAACNDGLFCNGADSCASGSCGQHAGSPCSGADGDSNCAESCNEQLDGCTLADPDGSPCDDGLFCNGSDTCASGSCSLHPGSPCPGPDGDGDCAESCNETNDTCTADDANGSACNDGVFCDGPDTCMAGSCSQHAGTPCPGADGDGNCAESCSEAAGVCTAFDPDGAACSDGNSCTADDACNGAGACVGGPAIDCDDSDPCTTDTCADGDPQCAHPKIPNCPPSTTTTTLAGFVCGDVNGDESVSAGDALAVLQSAVGGTKCAGKFCICDVNGNSSLSATDALFVLRVAVQLPVTLACNC